MIKKKKLFKPTAVDINDIEIESADNADEIISLHKSIRRNARKNGKLVTNKKLHSSSMIKKKKINLAKSRRIKVKNANKELNKHLRNGGSIKDEKAKKLLDVVNNTRQIHKNRYDKQLHKIRNTTLPVGSGAVPNLLDFGITFHEAKFVAEYSKDFDELRAAKAAKIVRPGMSKSDIEYIIDKTLSNPNVANALQNVVQDQIQRTLVTSDRTITQIAKMAFADPIELYNDDNTLKDMKDIPYAIRVCISEVTHNNLYDGHGADRRVIGQTVKVKLHDSLKALQILLKDFRDKGQKMQNINQFNIFGPSNFNLQDRIKELSDNELDTLLKLTNTGKETEIKQLPESVEIDESEMNVIDMARKKSKEDGIELYSIDELKEIEQCSLDK